MASWRWQKSSEFIRDGKVVPDLVEGLNLADARKIKAAVGVPVLCTGGFQHAQRIIDAIERGDCDGVTMARTLLANPDLPNLLRAGRPGPTRPCTYCNKCLLFVVDHPLGCYDETRFSSNDEMMRRLMDFYQDETEVPPPETHEHSPGRWTPPSEPAGTFSPPYSEPQPAVAPSPATGDRGWRRMFYFKAIWNWCASALFHFADAPIRRFVGDDAPIDPVYRDLFLSSAVVFGIGFWLVGNAPLCRLGIVRLGILAQLCVFVLSAYYLALGKIRVLQAVPGVVDLVFAVLFMCFLATRTGRDRGTS